MPMVKRLVADFFGQAPLSDIDPDLVVAQGAAIQGRALATARAQFAVPPAPPPIAIKKKPSGPPPARAGLMGKLPSLPPIQPAGAILIAGTPSPTTPAILPAVLTLDDSALIELPGPGDLAPEPPEPPEPPAPRALPPPLLLDVTPLSLGVETVGGYCEHIIRRNAPIPAEQGQVFSTARDDQSSVHIAICQGESRRIDENQRLGEIALDDIAPGPRGAAKIAVTFIIDADGSLGVSARDLVSGREQRIQIRRIGALDDAELDALAARHEAKLA
jgi:molecular chaperone DnaK